MTMVQTWMLKINSKGMTKLLFETFGYLKKINGAVRNCYTDLKRVLTFQRVEYKVPNMNTYSFMAKGKNEYYVTQSSGKVFQLI